jgi:Putative zinc-finger
MAPAADCPDLEYIAAFLDGTLPADQRQRLTEHLASCESCYEIFAGTARFQDDQRREQGLETAPKLPFDRRRRVARDPRSGGGAWWARSVAAGIAALLAVTAGLLVVRWRASAGAELSTERLAASLAREAAVQANVPWEGRPKRGPADSSEVPFELQSFRLGVRFLDLHLALAGGDRDRAAAALRRLDGVLGGIDLLPRETGAAYHRMGEALRAGAAPGSLLAAARVQEGKGFEGLADATYVELGRWTEACRLAGQARRSELFGGGATRRLLERTLAPGSQTAKDLGPRAAATLAGIRAAARGARPDPAELGRRCQDLLDQLDAD